MKIYLIYETIQIVGHREVVSFTFSLPEAKGYVEKRVGYVSSWRYKYNPLSEKEQHCFYPLDRSGNPISGYMITELER